MSKESNQKIFSKNVSDRDWEQSEYWNGLQLSTLVDYPANTVKYGNRFKEFPVEAYFEGIETIKIQISEFIKPFKFYFLISKLKSHFIQLNKNMKNFYEQIDESSTELAMKSCHIFPGQICAVPTADKNWARGIVSTYLFGKHIKVFLVDLGVEITVASKLLKYLKTEFMHLPRQAVRGQLANVDEILDDSKFKRRLKMKLQEKALAEMFTANIVQIVYLQEKRIIHLHIEAIYDWLIKNGFAEGLMEKYGQKIYL